MHKNFDWKSWYAPSYPKISFKTRKLQENRRVPLQSFSFRSCETKNSSTKPWCPLLLCMKFFDQRISLKHQSVLQRNILVQSDKNFSLENRDTPPFLSIEDFSFQKFSKTKNGSPAKFSRSCEKINFDKIVKLPPLLCLKKFYTRILSKDRSVLLRILSAQWDKKFSTEFSDIPFLCIKISIPEF